MDVCQYTCAIGHPTPLRPTVEDDLITNRVESYKDQAIVFPTIVGTQKEPATNWPVL